MIVTIHQPHFLPWLGYMERMRRADLFILLDHVQYERQNYQNRVKIKTNHGPRWLTVPVSRGSQSDTILEKVVLDGWDGNTTWGQRAFMSLWYPYRRAACFDLYAGPIKEILEARWERLVDLDLKTIEFLREALSIKTPMVRSSELGATSQKSDLILELCRKVGADVFLGGLGGSRGYLDEQAFAEAGIRIEWHEFRHPRYWQQPKPDEFVEGLSAIDLLFNCGPRSAEILAEAGRQPVPLAALGMSEENGNGKREQPDHSRREAEARFGV